MLLVHTAWGSSGNNRWLKGCSRDASAYIIALLHITAFSRCAISAVHALCAVAAVGDFGVDNANELAVR